MINQALRLIRIFHDFKANYMAGLLGISAGYLSEIEKGKKAPSLALLEQYAKIFKMPVSTIISFSEKLRANQKGIKAMIAKSIVSFLMNLESNSK